MDYEIIVGLTPAVPLNEELLCHLVAKINPLFSYEDTTTLCTQTKFI